MSKEGLLIQDRAETRHLWFFVGLVCLATLAYCLPLLRFANYAWSNDLHSHCLLIPLVSVYLLWLRSADKLLVKDISLVRTIILIAPALLLALLLCLPVGDSIASEDRHSLWVLSFLGTGLAIFLGLFGWRSLKRLFFPVAFLIFCIPLPRFAAEYLENVLMVGSAVITYWFFLLAGTSIEKEGQLLILPVINLEVARECSGIRSTWVLFITAVLGAHLFLKTKWHRLILVAAIVPLGIFRNALRIFVIGQLCVMQGPEMIDHWIHRKGGPVFFGISLLPLFLLLLLLIWTEKRRDKAEVLDGLDEKLE